LGGDVLHRAARLMTQKGFVGLSARELAEALDVSKANLFYHLKSKETLLYEIFVEALEHTQRRVEEILARPDPAAAKLRLLIDFYVQLMTDRPAVMLVWFRERGHLTAKHQKHVTQIEKRFLDPLLEFYRRAVEEGEFRPMDPILARMVIFGMCFQLVKYPHLRKGMSVETISQQLQQFACEGLLQHGSR
jgi:AcrR family transcriptional regulator